MHLEDYHSDGLFNWRFEKERYFSFKPCQARYVIDIEPHTLTVTLIHAKEKRVRSADDNIPASGVAVNRLALHQYRDSGH